MIVSSESEVSVIVTGHDKPGVAQRGLLIAARISIALLILAHGLPLVLRSLHLWGLDQWRYIPAGWAWAALILGLLLLLPPVSALLKRPAEFIGRFGTAERSRRASFLIYIVVLVFSAAVYWTFRNATHFLGDGFLWANHLMKDIIFHEPVSTWMYRGVYRGLNAAVIFGEISPVMSSAITSVISGLVFVVFAHRTARLLSEKRGEYALFITALFSCGTVMLFFGYVETYPPVAAGVMSFLYFGLRRLRGGGSMIPAALALLVTIILHLSAVALLPGLLILYYLHAGRGAYIKRPGISLIIAAAGAFAVMWVLQVSGAFGGFFSGYFLPLLVSSSNQDISYPVLSLSALFDLANELLLVCPLIVLLPAVLVAGHGRRSPAAGSGNTSDPPNDPLHEPSLGPPRERMFLTVSAFFYILAFVAFNKVIGASRDWDLFSPLALPLALGIALMSRDAFPKRSGELAVLTAAVIVTHTMPWIALNTSRYWSEARFVDLCDHGFWSDRARGYGYSTLGEYNRKYGKTLRAIDFYGRASMHDPGNVKYNYSIGEMYSNLDKHGAALEHYFKVLERRGDHLEALNNAGVSYLELGRPAEAEQYFRRAFDVDPSSAGVMRNLGYIYLETDRPLAALELFEHASRTDAETAEYLIQVGLHYLERPQSRTAETFLLHLAETRPDDIRIPHGLGMKYLEYGDNARAIEMLGRAVEVNPAYSQLHVSLARAYVASGDMDSARKHAEAARRLDPRLPITLLEDIREERANAPGD